MRTPANRRVAGQGQSRSTISASSTRPAATDRRAFSSSDSTQRAKSARARRAPRPDASAPLRSAAAIRVSEIGAQHRDCAAPCVRTRQHACLLARRQRGPEAFEARFTLRLFCRIFAVICFEPRNQQPHFGRANAPGQIFRARIIHGNGGRDPNEVRIGRGVSLSGGSRATRCATIASTWESAPASSACTARAASGGESRCICSKCGPTVARNRSAARTCSAVLSGNSPAADAADGARVKSALSRLARTVSSRLSMGAFT